ncbi:methyl-accepting chemotaxis protein [Silvanigrella aquatica]|uniref:Methyl-accepting transducer domain-containing protein n=1 Tax=Silvanigrella aquatica TaxID=1915309 RepID=A0A1L4D2K6_9BACT|nr:methyl-accepting chemotaxis protein [Silvanigrella aquatica]APJ04433.1 hypothetical protein AXG55_11150 [Silvanigrella aquatica]
MLKKLSIKQKMIYWNALVVIVFAVTLVYLGADSLDEMLHEKKIQIKNLTESVAGIINSYIKLEKEGKLTHEEAYNSIKTAIYAARYDGDNYFFVGDLEMHQVINPKRPKDDGVVQTLPQYKQFVEIASRNKGGDYLSYKTTRAGSKEEFPKLTYLIPIPEWKWYVGTGIYIDDIEKQRNKIIVIDSLITIFICIFLMGGGIFLANFISKPLAFLVKELKTSSHTMEDKSNNLTTLSKNVGSSSKEQASSIQETAAAIAEVTSMIARTSALTQNSENLSSIINKQIDMGNHTVQKMVTAMASIQEASQKLSEIEHIIIKIEEKAKVINDIVNKTELLSLNASIESARAGEYGKGFAVVAEEVGNLAKSSGKSSDEIRDLLEQSRSNVKSILELTVARVAEGQNTTEEVSKIFTEIVHDINEIHIQLTQVTEATKEQEIGVKQISQAMNKIDQSAINNLKSAEESIISSHQILDISIDLKKIATATESIVFGEKIA